MIKLSEQAWSIKDLLNGLKITPKIATQSQKILSAFLHFDCLQDKLIFMTEGFFRVQHELSLCFVMLMLLKL